jgi:ABC-type bacteriocin/lantibiotic exporter with double-glycine peptidase domain
MAAQRRAKTHLASAVARGVPRLRLVTTSFRQTRALCGPACLKIVMAYFGAHVAERQLAKACRSSRVSGTTGANLVTGARRFGFRAKVLDRSSFRAIETWLRRGIPVIVDWMSTVSVRPSGPSIPCGHYSVVCGIDRTHLTLQDPAHGRRRRISRKVFRSLWFDFKLVFPREASDLVIRRLIVVAPREFLSTTRRRAS